MAATAVTQESAPALRKLTLMMREIPNSKLPFAQYSVPITTVTKSQVSAHQHT
jgi:hypothetical protein